MQVPLGICAAIGVYFSIPKSFTSGNHGKEGSMYSKLKRIDYLGAFILVSESGCRDEIIAWLAAY